VDLFFYYFLIHPCRDITNFEIFIGMNIQYTQEEFDNVKGMDLLKLKCEHCGQIFLATKTRIASELKNPQNRNKYCSVECCNNEFKKRGEETKWAVVKCQHCGKEFKKLKKALKAVPNSFCSRECFIEHQKELSIEGKGNFSTVPILDKFNDDEFTQIINESTSYREAIIKFGYNSCNGVTMLLIDKRCEKLGITHNFKDNKRALGVYKHLLSTKGEIREIRSNYQSNRTEFRKIAKSVFEMFGGNKTCYICGYKHVEIAHIKGVADFDDNALLYTMSLPSNLVGLCPNHHWELDSGNMQQELLDKIKEYQETKKDDDARFIEMVNNKEPLIKKP